MNKISRRALAYWAADQLASGKSAAEVSKHLAAVLKQSKMADQVSFLISDIMWELEQRQALTVGKIITAHPISEQLEKSIMQQLKNVSGSADVSIENTVDKSVLGGVRIETTQHVWDQTVSRKLAELREVF